MRRVVLDTNVVLDCWVFDDPATRELKARLHAGRIAAVRSAATDAELADVLARPRFGLDARARADMLALWRELATPLEAAGSAPIRCADRDDQKFLDLAHAARAFALLTRDKALLASAARARAHGLHVLHPGVPTSVLLFEDDLP